MLTQRDIMSLLLTSKADKQRIRKSIKTKLVSNPIECGKPLQYSLKGLRRLRVGNYRVIFQIDLETKNCPHCDDRASARNL